MADDAQQIVDSVLANPEARRRLTEALARDLAAQSGRQFWQRARPILAGVSSAAVVLLAFLIPSLEDQWNAYRTRSAVDRYAEVASSLLEDGHYASAEQGFQRALELAGNERLDLLEGEIKARVMRVYENPDWRGQVGDDISEADFLYLLELQTTTADQKERAATLAAYGTFLAGLDRTDDAERVLKEAITLDGGAAAPHVHLGNLYDDLSRPQDAEAEYRTGIALNPGDPNARYDLGLLLAGTDRPALAEAEFRSALKLKPHEVDSWLALIESLESQGKVVDARREAQAALRLNPGSPEVKAAVARLKAAP